MEPKVSIIIPCFNLGEFLEEAVDSVFAQSCQDFEIVIVNDGSTDAATNRLLARFRRPRTTVLHSENRGLAAARNLAIEHARGRYLCALDADDKLHPSFLEKTTAILDGDPSIAFVSTWLEIFGTESWVWKQDRLDLPKLLSECVVLTAAPVRREAVLAVGGYDARLFSGHEDWDFWIGVIEQGMRGVIIPEILFYYRRRPGQMSETCDRGAERLRLWGNLLAKHSASYQRHWTEVLLLREQECGRYLCENAILEREVEGLRKGDAP
jgi:glycosyltransferase involved in cell wall biosynthesis